MAKQSSTRSGRSAVKKQAKPARLAAKPVKKGGAKPAAKSPARRAVAAASTAAPVKPPAVPGPPPVPAPAADATPSPEAISRELAIRAFERGFQALQLRQYDRAAAMLGALVTDFPDEKELHERARVYLNICQRQIKSDGPRPSSFDDRLNAATVAINQGDYAAGLEALSALAAEDRSSDHVHYLMAVVHALRGEVEAALGHLHEAVELNPENRYLASQDVDFEPLRHDAGFTALLDGPMARRRAVTRVRR